MSTWQVRQEIFVLVVVGFCIGFVHKVSSLCDSLIRHQVPPHVILFLELPDNASSSSSSIFPAAPSFPSGSAKQLHSKDSKDKDDISWGTLTGNAVYAVTRTINKFPIEVELKEYRFIIRGVGHQTTISHMLRHSYVKHYDAVIKYYEMGTKVQLGPEQESDLFTHAHDTTGVRDLLRPACGRIAKRLNLPRNMLQRSVTLYKPT